MNTKRLIVLCVVCSVLLCACGNSSSGSSKTAPNVNIIYTDLNFDATPEEVVKGMGREADKVNDNALGGKTYSYNYSGALGKETSRITYDYDGNNRMCYIDWDYKAEDEEDYSATMDSLVKQLTAEHGETVNEGEEAYYWLDNDVNIRLIGIGAGPLQVIHCTYYEPSYFEEWQNESQ